MKQEVLATIRPSSPRRWVGVGMLSTVGLLSVYVALATPPEPAWIVFLLVIGAGSFWLAYRMLQATSDWIELTETELRTGAGHLIARIEDIETIDQGVFAFKPSNGFLLKTKESAKNTWAPGLWWRLGRRVGVGGLTTAAETKFMLQGLQQLVHLAGKNHPKHRL